MSHVTCFAYSVFEVAWPDRNERGLTLFTWEIPNHMVLSCSSSNFFPGGIILCPAYLLVRGNICGARPLVSFFKEFRVSIVQCLFTLVAPAAIPTAARLITPPYLWRLIAMLSTKIKPLSLTFQHPIYHSLVVLVSLFPSRDMYHLSRGIKEVCPTFSPLSIACFPW